jgi:hypothetical protein
VLGTKLSAAPCNGKPIEEYDQTLTSLGSNTDPRSLSDSVDVSGSHSGLFKPSDAIAEDLLLFLKATGYCTDMHGSSPCGSRLEYPHAGLASHKYEKNTWTKIYQTSFSSPKGFSPTTSAEAKNTDARYPERL